MAREAYGRAEDRFQAGDFEAAGRECESAPRLDPGCAEADALYLEVQFVLGHAAWPEMERYIACTWGHRQDQVFLEIREALQRGKVLYDLREFDGAEREFRSVLEYVKWLPEDLDVLQVRREAAVWLEYSRLDHP